MTDFPVFDSLSRAEKNNVLAQLDMLMTQVTEAPMDGPGSKFDGIADLFLLVSKMMGLTVEEYLSLDENGDGKFGQAIRRSQLERMPVGIMN